MKQEPTDIYDTVNHDIEFLTKQNKKLCTADEKAIRLWDGEKWYEIEFSACNSNEKTIQWIYHLIEQCWISVKQINLFLEAIDTKQSSLATDW
jgi:hypothetical protein